MIISLGFIRSANQILIRELNWHENTVANKIIDSTDLEDFHLQGLLIEDNEEARSLINLLEKEKRFYPIIDGGDENLNLSLFESLSPELLKELYLKMNHRWTLHHNLEMVEKMWKYMNHFRALWTSDRLSFFEEFWYSLKNNLGGVELTLIFNDLATTEEKDEGHEKKDRPKLIQTMLSGTKKAHFHSCGAKEKDLMQHYLPAQGEIFEITEFNSAKAQFVATAQINRSPILILAKTPALNQLQRVILSGLFQGLQD